MRYVSRYFHALLPAAVALFLLPAALAPARAQVNVLTQHNDTSRTGDNLAETILNTSNVNVTGFGMVFSCPVDGYVYAQPLYVSGLSIDSATHNVVFVATEHDSVYAFDADSGAPLWTRSLGTSVLSTDYGSGYHDLTPEIGITGTPVIDLSTDTMYVDAFTKDTNGNYHHYLHALNITTGQDQADSPVEITGSVPGTSWDSSNDILTFDPYQHLQRPGLLLSNGTVYVSLGSHGDYEPYHGWVFAYNAATLAQEAIYCTTPNGQEGGIWMGGQGPVADSSGNIYVMVGNSDENYENNAGDFGESFIKLTLSGNTLGETDYFKPNNYDSLNAGDVDLGSAGPMLLPGTSDLIGGGKEGILYLVSTTGMGGLNLSQDQMLQEWQATTPEINQSPIYWNSPASGPTIYIWASYGDVLKSYNMSNGHFNSSPLSQGQITSPGLPGGCLSLSANGSTAGTGIVWATHSVSGDANQSIQHGELDAFDATNLTTPLWTSLQNQARDDLGNVAKFAPPTVANGKVYVATFSGKLDVYGLIFKVANISPATITMGSPGFTLNVNGTGFVPGSVVDWDNTPLATTFVSSQQLTAAVPAQDVASVQPASITVTNPGPLVSSAQPFIIKPLYTFPAGLQLFSVPYDYSAQSLSSVLGYGNPQLAVWETSLSQYIISPESPADGIRLGQGYWARFPNAVALTSAGNAASTTSLFSISLSPGWNMVGDPFPTPVNMANLMVEQGAGPTETLPQAVQAGIVGSTLYSYPAGSSAYTSQTSGSLSPYTGYWVYAFASCTLQIPPP